MKHILSGILKVLCKEERIKLFKLILFDFLIGLLDIAFLGGLLVVINFYTKGAIPPKISFLPQVLLNPGSLLLIGVFLALFSLKNWFGFIGQKAQHHFFYEVASRLSKQNIINYLNDDHSRFVNIDSSVQVRKISNQPIEFSHYLLNNFQAVISQVVLILFTAIAILFYHPTLFLLLFLLLLPPVVLLAWFIRNKLKAIRAHIKITSTKTLQHLNESLSGYVESNIYGKNDFFTERYYHYQKQLNEDIATQQTLQTLPSRLIEVFAVLGFFILIAVNRLSASVPAIDLLTIGIFMAASYKIIPGIVKILNSTGQMKTYQFTLNDLLAVGEPAKKHAGDSAKKLGTVKFDNVFFSYKEHQVLQNTTFEIIPGDMVGLSASSGRGKTTLINLLLGFLEPDKGSICLNGALAIGVDRQQYWARISFVKQQPFFIHDTILKNITLSYENYDRVKLAEVLSFCGIDKLLDKHPEGIEKVIKENGKNISGGQRQRIMLARALYHDFDLLILDEPFGEMDDDAEREILLQLEVLAKTGKMILFITHNKASLSFCNKIISLDGE